MAFKEAEVVKRLPQKLSQDNAPVIMGGGRERESQGVSLMQILGKTVAEFSQLPKGRRPDVFPEDALPDINAYFESEDTLVLLRQRRPIDYGRGIPHKTVRDGIFAEVWEKKDGKLINGFSRTNYSDGLYKRIEVTDESDDPFKGLWLTPTVFNRTIRERLGEKMSNQPKALPSPGDEKLGILGQLLAQRQSADIGHEKKQDERKSIFEEIRKEFFHEESTQGLDSEVGNSHFVIAGDENSQLAKVSKELGLETHVVLPDKTWKNASPNVIDGFRDDSGKPGKRPMLISIDRFSFEGKEIPELLQPADMAKGQVLNYAKTGFDLNNPLGNPLFFFIEWQNKTGEPDAIRISEGWFTLHGNDPETAKKLMTKVLIDYLFTSDVREMAKALS